MTSSEQRQGQILDLLLDKKKVRVSELSDILGVTPVTIRKDLTWLENHFLIRREQGSAVLNDRTSVNVRLARNYTAKRAIARKAAGFIEDRDTIFIESGSSCILLAYELSLMKKNVTVITNSTFLPLFTGPATSLHIVLTGGEYQQDDMSLVGPLAKLTLESFQVRYFFTGVNGYRLQRGFTADNIQRVEMLRTMSEKAEKTVIMAESQKFSHNGILPLYSPDEVDILVTDVPVPDPEIAAELAGKINIITVSPAGSSGPMT